MDGVQWFYACMDELGKRWVCCEARVKRSAAGVVVCRC
jgi:hypothetical protein